MRAVLGTSRENSHEIERNSIHDRESSFPFPNFVLFARARWPKKTASELAARTRYSERVAKFWLAGKFEPPAEAFQAIMDELFKRGRPR